MRRRIGRALAAALLALAAGSVGCSYQISGNMEVFAPGKLEGVRRVAVAPFSYPHDWTGHFRDIYRRADVPPPPGRKVDRIEATFLVEDALAARGYRTLPWPNDEEVLAPGQPPAALLNRLRARGVQAVLLVRGSTRCESADMCAARVAMTLWDAAGGERLWTAEASAQTLIFLGDEMQAAVREALSGLPAKERR
jgi:hypothetical protein